MHALHVRGLTKTFGGRFGRRQEALRGIDLTLDRGAGFGLIGPNGAGKTTFIKALLGIVCPSAGEIQVLGGSPADPAIRARIGYLPERLHLPGADTPLTFLAGVSRLKGLRSSTRELEELVAHVGLAAATGRRIGGFSKGMRQRLGLAAALLGRPDLLILDEPTDGIDPMGRVEVRKILAGELARGATLFLNSHLLSETERICDSLGILSAGRLIRQGPLASLRQLRFAWQARFESVPDEAALREAGFTPVGAPEPSVPLPVRWRVEAADASALNARLDRARASGALLLELTREAQDLEAVLAEAMEVAA